jgi:hypothetical protein
MRIRDTTTRGGSVSGRAAWLIALPLLVAGSLLGHQLAYLVVAGHHAEALLADSGHGYLQQLPTGAVLGGVCLALGVFFATVDRFRGRRGKDVPAWAVGAIPLLGFAGQEHIERLIHDGSWPLQAALEPTFAIGLALQVPFALCAYLVARLLVRAIVELVELVRAQWVPPRFRAVVVRRTGLPRANRVLLECHLAPRGPPWL